MKSCFKPTGWDPQNATPQWWREHRDFMLNDNQKFMLPLLKRYVMHYDLNEGTGDGWPKEVGHVILQWVEAVAMSTTQIRKKKGLPNPMLMVQAD